MQNVFLKELKSGARGVIGVLAGIGALKPVFLDFKATLLVKKESDGGFKNLSVKELRDF